MSNPIRIAAAAAALIAAGACSRLPPGAREARALAARGDFPAAEARADRALQADPDHPALWRIKLQAVMGQGDPARAVALYAGWRARRGGDDRAALRAMAMHTVWQGLRVPSAAVGVRAIQAVERVEIQALARDVSDRVADDDDAVAAAAAIAVLRSDPQAPRVASSLLRSDDPDARAIVVEGVGRKLGRQALPQLRAALGDPHPAVRRAGARALGRLGAVDRADATALAALATRDPEPPVRASAVRALAELPSPGPLELAAAGLRDPDTEVRLAAVALARAHGQAGSPVLVEAGRGDDLAVAVAAVAAQAHGVAAGQAALERAAASPEPTARAAAARAALMIAPRGVALKLLSAASEDSDHEVRLAAARALAAIHDPRGLEILSALCASERADIAADAIAAHAELRRITPGLVAALAAEAGLIRIAAAEALLLQVY